MLDVRKFVNTIVLSVFSVFNVLCWMGGRKSIWPAKLSDEVLTWLSVWSEVQTVCIWSS